MSILDPDSDIAAKRRLDDFAEVALAGMLAHPKRYQPRAGDPSNWHDAIAKEAYEIAEAMNRARPANRTVENFPLPSRKDTSRLRDLAEYLEQSDPDSSSQEDAAAIRRVVDAIVLNP